MNFDKPKVTPMATEVPKKPATFRDELDEAQRTLRTSLEDGMARDQADMKKQWADMDAHYGASPDSPAPEGLKSPTESGTSGESVSLEDLYAVSKFEAVDLNKEEALVIGETIQNELNGPDSGGSYGMGTGPGHQIRILGVRWEGNSGYAIRVMVDSGTKDFPDQHPCDVLMMKNNKGEWEFASAWAPTGREK